MKMSSGLHAHLPSLHTALATHCTVWVHTPPTEAFSTMEDKLRHQIYWTNHESIHLVQNMEQEPRVKEVELSLLPM